MSVGGEAFLEEDRPFVHGVVRSEGVIVGEKRVDDVHEFGMTTRFKVAVRTLVDQVIREGWWECEVLVTLLQVLGPVSNRASHEAGEDKVELCAEVPLVFEVINVEANVWWDTSRVSRAIQIQYEARRFVTHNAG